MFSLKQLPAAVQEKFGKLFGNIRPRFIEGGKIQVACPNPFVMTFITEGNGDWDWYKMERIPDIYEEVVTKYHRMKICLKEDKWWCPKCRKGGKLSTLNLQQ